jgi:hypothetical protein
MLQAEDGVFPARNGLIGINGCGGDCKEGNGAQTE